MLRAVNLDTTNVVISNPDHGEMYLIQNYVIKFVRQVGGFLRVLQISSTEKTDHHDIAKILLRVALTTINQSIEIYLRIH